MRPHLSRAGVSVLPRPRSVRHSIKRKTFVSVSFAEPSHPPGAKHLLLWEKQHPAADLPLFERCMGLSSICQRVRAIDPDGKLPLLYPGHKPLEVLRILLDVRETIRARKK
jgi:hypothetical protein